MKYTINKNPDGPLYITEDELKLNYRCSKEEQHGEGPGSCGGSKGDKQNPKDVLKKVDDAKSLIAKNKVTSTTSVDGRTTTYKKGDITAVVRHGPDVSTVTIGDKSKSFRSRDAAHKYMSDNILGKSSISSTKPIKVPRSYYQTADEDQRDFDETKKDLINSLLVRADKSGEVDAKGTKSIIDAVDRSITKLEKDLASTEKYYKDELQEDDKDVGMNIFHMKNKIAIMRDINDDNKKFYKEKF